MRPSSPGKQFREGWPCLAVFILLGASHLIAGIWLGRSWIVITAIAAEVIWLIARPWRWRRLSPSVRQRIRLGGTAALGVFILIGILLNWQFPSR